MKVAFATEDMQHVDAHFGWARNIVIYEVEPTGFRKVEAVRFEGDLQEDGSEDKLAPKLDAIADCAIVYVAAIGGSAAARVVNARVHPVKVPRPEPIANLLTRLVEVLNGTPPPWLRKAMMKGRERRPDFEEGEVTHG
ncbi:MAG TPA: nitrogen fixation protein NifX [Burkholderiales bacterium]